MFDNNFFDTERQGEVSASGGAVGTVGIWLLHLTKLSFLVYSAVHGVSAALQYAGSSEWQKAAQVAGIIIIELTLLGVYLALMNSKIQGGGQGVAAALTYAFAFILAVLGIAADSQLNAGLTLSSWLSLYLRWGLPLAPGICAIGGLAIHLLEPEKRRERDEAKTRRELEEEKFKAKLANERATLEEAKALRRMQLASRQAVLQQLYHVYAGDDVQRAIAATASQNAPALLRAAGIDVEALGIRPQALEAQMAAGQPGGSAQPYYFLNDAADGGREYEGADLEDLKNYARHCPFPTEIVDTSGRVIWRCKGNERIAAAEQEGAERRKKTQPAKTAVSRPADLMAEYAANNGRHEGPLP